MGDQDQEEDWLARRDQGVRPKSVKQRRVSSKRADLESREYLLQRPKKSKAPVQCSWRQESKSGKMDEKLIPDIPSVERCAKKPARQKRKAKRPQYIAQRAPSERKEDQLVRGTAGANATTYGRKYSRGGKRRDGNRRRTQFIKVQSKPDNRLGENNSQGSRGKQWEDREGVMSCEASTAAGHSHQRNEQFRMCWTGRGRGYGGGRGGEMRSAYAQSQEYLRMEAHHNRDHRVSSADYSDGDFQDGISVREAWPQRPNTDGRSMPRGAPEKGRNRPKMGRGSRVQPLMPSEASAVAATTKPKSEKTGASARSPGTDAAGTSEVDFEPKNLLVKGLNKETSHDGLQNYMEVVSGDEVVEIVFLGEGQALVTLKSSISGEISIKN